jgi:RNA polymerase sigma-70 factor (ECF subfamily)
MSIAEAVPQTEAQAPTSQYDPVAWRPGAKSTTSVPKPTEQELEMVRRAQAGDSGAFDWLYERYYSPIYNYVYRMVGDSKTAEDLTQDAFLKAWLALDKYNDTGKVGAWFFRIATNVCLDHIRHVRLLKWQPWETFLSAFHPAQIAAHHERPDAIAVASEDRDEVRMILSQLNPRFRQVMFMREYLDLTYDEIAERTNSTRAAVKSILFRAREEFRKVYANFPRQPGRVTGEDVRRGRKRFRANHKGTEIVARREAIGASQRQVVIRMSCSHARLSLLEQTGHATDVFLARVEQTLSEMEREAAARESAQAAQAGVS